MKSPLAKMASAVAFLLLVPYAAPAATVRTVTVSGTGASLTSVRLLSSPFMHANPDVRIEIMPILGTGGSIKAILAGKLDIGVGGRPLKDTERSAGVSAVPYARVPFVFAVHPTVHVTGITLREVVDIYSGRKTTWADGSPIRLILRPEGESDLDALRGISRAMETAVKTALQRKGMIYAMNDHESADFIEHTPGAIGALTLTMATLDKRSIRVLPLDGVTPTTAALVDGRYRYSKEFYFITGKAPSDAARRFIAFARSREGAAILIHAGFVPLR